MTRIELVAKLNRALSAADGLENRNPDSNFYTDWSLASAHVQHVEGNTLCAIASPVNDAQLEYVESTMEERGWASVLPEQDCNLDTNKSTLVLDIAHINPDDIDRFLESLDGPG
ncbi:hypothetical protein N9Z27_00085 [Alphaproteobacteria bacterium]|nr:hypothetical protein [Alphaproteobacteria bacterium]